MERPTTSVLDYCLSVLGLTIFFGVVVWRVYRPFATTTVQEQVSAVTADLRRWVNGARRPNDLPEDKFAVAPKRISINPTEGRIWSIGPDHTNNEGLITYDPTNGARSAGDVVMYFERRR